MSLTMERPRIAGKITLAHLRKAAPVSVAVVTSASPVAREKPARDLSDARIEGRVATLALARQHWPALFDFEHPVVLAIGITEAMLAAGVGLEDRATRDLLFWWCHLPRYVAARQAGAVRYGLDGESAGSVDAIPTRESPSLRGHDPLA